MKHEFLFVKTWRPHYPQYNVANNSQRFSFVMLVAVNVALSR